MLKFKNSVIAGICFILSLVSLAGCDSSDSVTPIPDENGQLMMRSSSSSLIDTNYESTIKKLKKYGFTNFKVTFINDVILGLFVTEDDIDSISINGKSDFDKGDMFVARSVIAMNVHSKHDGFQVTSKQYDGKGPIMYENDELNGQNMLTAAQSLKNIGFTNISFTPIMDCKSENDSKIHTVSGLSVSEKTLFYYYDCFESDALIKLSYHTTEGDYCINGLEHTLVNGESVEPTCTESGWTSGTYCSVCNKIIAEKIEIPAKGHTIVIDKEGKPATCTSEGLSDESHCSVCGEKTSEQHVLPIDPSNHVNVETTKGYAATCTKAGLSDTIVCNDCGVIVEEQQELPIDPSNHVNIVQDAAIRPSNGIDGKSAGSHCEDCNAVIKSGTIIPWSGSVEEKQATNDLEAYFPKELARKAVLTALCNYFSTDIFDSTGNYVVESKLHSYSYSSAKFSITSQGSWKWANKDEWKFEGFTIYGGNYGKSYPLYGYISMDSSKFHLSGVNNGKSDNPSQYITYYDSTCFNFARSLVE